MNQAVRTLIIWILINAKFEKGEVDEFLTTLETGLLRNEPDAVALKSRLISEAETWAKSADDSTELQELVVLARELDALEDAKKKANVLGSIRKVIDLPATSSMGERIRSNRLRDLIQGLR